MAANFSLSSGSYVLNKFPSISQWSDTGPSWPSGFLFLQCFLLIPREFLFLSYIYYTPLRRRGGYTVLALSILLSLTNVYGSTFLSNHASQPLQTWYGALARGPTSCLLNSGPPVIYFPFPGSVHFWTLHFGIARAYSVSKNSQISFFFVCNCFLFGPV